MDAKNINLELDSKILESENPLLKRCKMFLEDNDFIKANEYAQRVLDEDPECALAYLFLLMASDYHVDMA